jgi:hypothetical protein
MKKFRFYTALAIRVFGFILAFPTAVLYTISDIIKNNGDSFTF